MIPNLRCVALTADVTLQPLWIVRQLDMKNSEDGYRADHISGDSENDHLRILRLKYMI